MGTFLLVFLFSGTKASVWLIKLKAGQHQCASCVPSARPLSVNSLKCWDQMRFVVSPQCEEVSPAARVSSRTTKTRISGWWLTGDEALELPLLMWLCGYGVKLWEVRKRRKLLHKQSVSICTALRVLAFLLKLQMPKANFLKCFNYSTFHVLIIDLVPQLYFLQVLFKWRISRAVSDDFITFYIWWLSTVKSHQTMGTVLTEGWRWSATTLRQATEFKQEAQSVPRKPPPHITPPAAWTGACIHPVSITI